MGKKKYFIDFLDKVYIQFHTFIDFTDKINLKIYKI